VLLVLLAQLGSEQPALLELQVQQAQLELAQLERQGSKVINTAQHLYLVY
jgi:hypothetical protein